MTPEKIAEIAAIDQNIADKMVIFDQAYLELKGSIERYTAFCQEVIQV